MKKVLLATVAFSTLASGAFAQAGSAAINAALEDIQAAYAGIGGTVSGDTSSSMADLMYYVDNNGSVSDISFEGAGTDENGDYVAGELTISVHQYADEIADAKDDLIGSIKNDVFGDPTWTAANISISETDNVWSQSGVGGIAGAYIDNGLVVSLNNLETAIGHAADADFDAATLNGVMLAAAAVDASGADLDAKMTEVEGAYGASVNMLTATRLRDTSEGELVILHGGDEHVTRAHSALSGYQSIVDAALAD